MQTIDKPIDQQLLRECKEIAQEQGLTTVRNLENTQVHMAADGIVLALGSWTFESYEERVAFVAQVLEKVFNPAMANSTSTTNPQIEVPSSSGGLKTTDPAAPPGYAG